MQCPTCNQPLTAIDYQGVRIETCPACGGDWLDGGQLANIVKARQRRFTPQECDAVAQAAKITGVKLITLDRHLTCPNCGGTTHPINYGDDTGLIVDKCANCNGMWLEKGELDKIEELVQGWDDGLPADLAQYGPKLREVATTEQQFETVHISHIRLVDSVINGILDVFGV